MTGIDMCLVNEDRHCDRCGEYLCGYGYFTGGDPRRFIPDEEISTEEERDLHRRHCFAAAFFGVVHVPSIVGWLRLNDKGVKIVRFRASAYGPGTYATECMCWYVPPVRTDDEWKASVW